MDYEGFEDFDLCRDGNYRRRKKGIEAEAAECVQNMREMTRMSGMNFDTRTNLGNLSDELERIAPCLHWYEDMVKRGLL
jgi:hypothetical protein